MSIKVFIQTEKFKGGPAVFRSRIISELNKFDDIEITNSVKDDFDLELAFIRKVYFHDKPYILRVDGCYYQSGRKSGNKALEKAILRADHIIFQSNFSFDLCNRILNINSVIDGNNNHSIIYNGIDLDYVNGIVKDSSIKPGSFVAAARWRDNKRTFSIIKGFRKAKTGRHLYMIGDIGIGENASYANKIKKYESEYIHILGHKSQEETISILRACDYQIHLCHIDSCPNIVIEGMSCGLNVLCSNLGGTKELVKNNGVVLNADKMWSGQYLPSSVKLDSLKKEVVAKGIKKLMKIETKPNPSEFDIKEVAKKYAEIIRKINRR